MKVMEPGNNIEIKKLVNSTPREIKMHDIHKKINVLSNVETCELYTEMPDKRTSLLRESFCMTMYLALLPDIDMFSSWLMLLSAIFFCVSSSIFARTSACWAAMTCTDCCCSCCCCNCCCCNCCCWSCCCWSCNCWTAAGWTGTPVVVTTGVAEIGATTAVGVPDGKKSPHQQQKKVLTVSITVFSRHICVAVAWGKHSCYKACPCYFYYYLLMIFFSTLNHGWDSPT